MIATLRTATTNPAAARARRGFLTVTATALDSDATPQAVRLVFSPPDELAWLDVPREDALELARAILALLTPETR